MSQSVFFPSIMPATRGQFVCLSFLYRPPCRCFSCFLLVQSLSSFSPPPFSLTRWEAHTYTRTHIHTHSFTHTPQHAHLQPQTYAPIPSHTRTQAHTHPSTPTHTHTHTHTHAITQTTMTGGRCILLEVRSTEWKGWRTNEGEGR